MLHFKHLLLAGALVASVVSFSSCGSDDDDEPTQLSVSPSQITLLSDKNASASFSVNCNADWNIQADADWLNLSAISGTGNNSIVVTALSENASAQERTTIVTITANEETKQVTISQKAAYVSDCNVEFENILTMSTSIAFSVKLGSNVDFFYGGYLKTSSAAGWTDEKIVDWLTDDGQAFANEPGATFSMSGMVSGQEYYLVAIGYDKNGNRGELTKIRVTVPTVPNNPAVTEIYNVQVSTSKWYWSTYPNARVQRYYMIESDGDAGLLLALSCDASVAYFMKELIDEGTIEPYANSSQDWSTSRTSGANSIYIATWSVDVDNKYAAVIDCGYWTVSSSSAPQKSLSTPAFGGEIKMMSQSDKNIIRNHSHIYEVAE